ncbi:conserved hypothetical protein, partial [Ricinus communis]
MAKYICSGDGMMNVLIKGGRAVEKTTVRNDKSGVGNGRVEMQVYVSIAEEPEEIDVGGKYDGVNIEVGYEKNVNGGVEDE